MPVQPKPKGVLNGVCPYFTMFPLEFPRRILEKHARQGQRVLDPFCGRGTTNFAARLMGLNSLGIDSNPVAAAVTQAKLVSTTPEAVVQVAERILDAVPRAEIPQGEFWRLAYERSVLASLCRLREGLRRDCSSNARKVLRAIILGALHGPLRKTTQSYFSNQCTRTYAPKPGYAIRYWRANDLRPPRVDVLPLIGRRAAHFLSEAVPKCLGKAVLGDSRVSDVLLRAAEEDFDWVITSPPYYGMRTYMQDQWLRNWFAGGPDTVDYRHVNQLEHTSPSIFSDELRKVWTSVARVCRSQAKLVIRFGGISDRRADPLSILKSSLTESGWRVRTLHSAGRADGGKRQADTFLRKRTRPLEEYDLWAELA